MSTRYDETLPESKVWDVMNAYFAKNSIIEHQLLSFNELITKYLQDVVDQDNRITVKGYTIVFGQVHVSKPHVLDDENRNIQLIYPAEARLQDLTYDAPLCVDIREEVTELDIPEIKEHRRVQIGRIPIMVRSVACNLFDTTKEERMMRGECPNDNGGCFIVKGKERVVVAQVRANYNSVTVLEQKQSDKYHYVAEVRSMSNETGHSVLIQCGIGWDDRTIKFSIPYIREHVPVGVVFKALGCLDEEDISNLLGFTEERLTKYTRYILRDSFFCQTVEDAHEYLGNRVMHTINEEEKRKAYAKQVVEMEILPHLGIDSSSKEKLCFLANIVRKLILTNIGFRPQDDRDNYANKRIETTGILMRDIFRNLFRKFTLQLLTNLEKRKQRPDILSLVSRTKMFTKGFQQCLSTGNWNVQRNATYMRRGVSQVLDRITHMATLSHLRRVIIPVGKEGKNGAMRQIHGTSFGFICPSETPEGEKIGIVLNMALTARITKKNSPVLVKNVLETCKTITNIANIPYKDIRSCTVVLLNGCIIGYTNDHKECVKEIRKFRNYGLIDREVSVSYDNLDDEVRVFCDEGRMYRPLLTVNEKNVLNLATYNGKLSWRHLLKNDIVRYVDSAEIENSVIAMYPVDLKTQRCDFCEIHPINMLGVVASTIPFSDHNQSPRNCYQSSMGKQALGVPVRNFYTRTDTLLHVLQYAQRSIVSTRVKEYLKCHEMPSGVNAMVAILCYGGWTQEDGILLNATSVQRGMFCLTSYHTLSCAEKKRDTYSFEEICMPPPHNNRKDSLAYFERRTGNYSLLDSNGIIKKRTDGETGEAVYVKKGDVIVGKVLITTDKNGNTKKEDVSVIIQAGEEGIIDNVYVTTNQSGYKLIKVVIRQWREPILGDKLASTHAQKGTIGMMYRQEDMPFTYSGISPDIVISPLCIPSRMTIGQIIECMLGKKCTMEGTYGDSTPFTDFSVNAATKITTEIESELKKYGFQSQGWETMYNGMTGEQIKALIYFGPTYYQRLKHLVADKMHARARGAKVALTAQAAEGRSRDGGLRVGEMERDCLIAHGASAMLKDRLFKVSDAYEVPICKNCNIITNMQNECQICKGDNVVMCNYPFAAKLLHTELTSLGLKIKLQPSDI